MEVPPGPFRPRAVASAVLLLAGACVAHAQPPPPHIGYVYPAGGRQGSTFQVVVGGQHLEGVETAFFSGTGITATVVEYSKPLTNKEFNLLRDQLKELMARKPVPAENKARRRPATTTARAWTDEDEKALAEVRKKLANPPARQGNPAIAEKVTLRVALAAKAEPGERGMRLKTPAGLTNPIVFQVGQLPEFQETESTGSPPDGRKERRFDPPPPGGGPDPVMPITLPATVNGRIMPGDVDRFSFSARQGERLVVAADARALIPYLPDAVPGWFQATMALYDRNNQEVAYDDDYRFHPDPVLFYRIPENGEYTIEIRDAIYRGREDFIYRIAIGPLPFITSIFPLGTQAGRQVQVELRGWNLPKSRLAPGTLNENPGVIALSIPKKNLLSNPVPFALDALPDLEEKEPNDPPEHAQPVTMPLVINGRIDKPGDEDRFAIQGGANMEVVAEVHARRLDSPVDSLLELTDAAGRQLAINDDHEDKGAGLTTHHADSYLRVTLPAEGTYYVGLRDAQHKGGPEYGYRLRLSEPRPDFELRVTPSSVNIRGGTSTPLTVYALRKDGFTDAIKLALEAAPEGLRLSGGLVPAGQDQVRITVSAPSIRMEEPFHLSIEGRAMIQGREVRRSAVPAEDMMQAFAYRHLVPATELMATLVGRRMPRNPIDVLSEMPVRIPNGGTVRVRVRAPLTSPQGRICFELNEPPEGIAIQSSSSTREGSEMVLHSDPAKVKTGLRGNLIVHVLTEAIPRSDNPQAKGNIRRTPIGTLPAIPFEVVAQ